LNNFKMPEPEESQALAGKAEDQLDPKLLEALPKEKRELVLQYVKTAAFQGPLPPPHMLEEYNRLIPNGADRLMRLVEGQAKHRQTQEERLIRAQTSLPSRGQWIGFLLCLIFGAIGWDLAKNGHDWVAGILFTTTIIGLIVVFVLGRSPQEGPKASTAEEENTDAS
jgi:uncharacterized membrane protein